MRCSGASGPSARLAKGEIYMAKTTKRGRDAITGRIIPVAVAMRRPKTAIVETVKLDEDGRPLN